MTGGLQKLLHPGMAAQILERGYDRVGGYVIDVADANALPTPEALFGAYRFSGDEGSSVDVVRFPVPACAAITRPEPVERPWPTYPTGFLYPVGDTVVPVFTLSTTRYPAGSEIWRIQSDGSQERILWYAGAARGWVGGRGWRPPSRFVGTRAVWRDTEYAADVVGADVELTAVQEPSDDGWSSPRPQTWTRTVPAGECEVYELVFGATVDGVAVRVLEVGGDLAHVQLVGDDPEAAQLIGAELIDPGVLENPAVPVASLRDTSLVANVRRA